MPKRTDPGSLTASGGRTPAREAVKASQAAVSHLSSDDSAHSASQVFLDPEVEDSVLSDNLQQALDELGVGIYPTLNRLGEYDTKSFNPIGTWPDWGILKTFDPPMDVRQGNTPAFDIEEAYGYWWTPPNPDGTRDFTDVIADGRDVQIDPTFNYADGSYTGGGLGTTFYGGFTRNEGGQNNIKVSHAIYQGPGSAVYTVLSGQVAPADRGVLALIHFPAGGDMASFLGQNLEDRCYAAILLGNGVLSGQDGTPGGIFSIGDDGSGNYDPFAFPGRATGQYDLRELHTATRKIATTVSSAGDPLPGLLADNTAGQVRLGTDPNAGIATITNGIPILGAGPSARGGGETNNFFAYRLPFLTNYTLTDNVAGSPSFKANLSKREGFSEELFRYLLRPEDGDPLARAGDYEDYSTSSSVFRQNWYLQRARFRHRFPFDKGPSFYGFGVSRDIGTFILLHFRTESAFERLVRDGIAPSDDDVYGVNLRDWNNVEADDNQYLADFSFGLNNVTFSPPYSIVRSKVFADTSSGVSDYSPTDVLEFDFTTTANQVVYVSGVQYFIPGYSGTPQEFRLTFDVQGTDGFFQNSYRTDSQSSILDTRPYANASPASLSLPAFAFEDANSYTTADFESSYQLKQRIDFTVEDVAATNNSYTNGPPFLEGFAVASSTFISISGDTSEVSFSRDAKPHIHLRRPLRHTTPASAVTQEALSEASLGKSVMFFSARPDNSPEYGNFVLTTGPSTIGGFVLASLETPLKDYQERFLDEVYRYRTDGGSWNLAHDDAALIVGPGLSGVAAKNVEIPVRAGSTVLVSPDGTTWNNASYLPQGYYQASLAAGELQVGGQPERSPDFTSSQSPARYPFTPTGMLLYPSIDYTTARRPSVSDGDTLLAQPNYSLASGDRSYMRVFDLAKSRSASPIPGLAGSTTVTVRVWGVSAGDFEFDGGGVPGNSASMALLVKIPGQTSWMDAGRDDGAGPGKQDAALDGAGCRTTTDGKSDSGADSVYGWHTNLQYTDVLINTGIGLFESANGEVPFMVKIVLRDTVGSRNLDGAGVAATASASGVEGIFMVECFSGNQL